MSVFTIPVLAAMLLQQAADNPTDVIQASGWQLRKPTTLKNAPRIVESKRSGDEVVLTAHNDGDTPLEYLATDTSHIQEWQDTEDRGIWKASNWDWCGTGKSMHTIEPGKSVQLKVRFWDKDKRERLLGMFSEKGTKRSGLVVLAAESAK